MEWTPTWGDSFFEDKGGQNFKKNMFEDMGLVAQRYKEKYVSGP